MVITKDGTWTGDENDENSLNGFYILARDYFTTHGCSKQDAMTYADAAVMAKFKMGVNQYIMDNNGNFKELNVKYLAKDDNGKPTFTLTICQ